MGIGFPIYIYIYILTKLFVVEQHVRPVAVSKQIVSSRRGENVAAAGVGMKTFLVVSGATFSTTLA
jgi:hypothetical protein